MKSRIAIMLALVAVSWSLAALNVHNHHGWNHKTGVTTR